MIRRTKLTFDAQRWKAEEALAREGVSIMVCAGTGCIASGAMAVYETLHGCARKRACRFPSVFRSTPTTPSISRKPAATASARSARL